MIYPPILVKNLLSYKACKGESEGWDSSYVGTKARGRRPGPVEGRTPHEPESRKIGDELRQV